MTYRADTPFDHIESALEYVNLLQEATGEAQEEIETEANLLTSPELARRKEALQLVSYKLGKLAFHMSASRRLLNDLRTLRRLLMEERQASEIPLPAAR
jgi:hypothetical protein